MGLKASLFVGLPLKVTPQQKDNLTMTGSRLGALLLSLNIQVKSRSHLKTKHVEHYVDARLSQGVG